MTVVIHSYQISRDVTYEFQSILSYFSNILRILRNRSHDRFMRTNCKREEIVSLGLERKTANH